MKAISDFLNELQPVHQPWYRVSRSRRVAGKLGVLRLQLGTQLKQFEQAQTALEKHV
jgi:hypothetical protein